MTRRIPMDVDPKFKRMLEEIRIGKIQNKTANELISYKRLTLAIANLSDITRIKNVLLEAEIEKEMKKRGLT